MEVRLEARHATSFPGDLRGGDHRGCDDQDAAGRTRYADAVGAPTLPGYVGAGSTAPVRPFLLSDVRLGSGLFQEKRDRMKNFIREFDERRFLVLFNRNAGRPNPAGVPVVGGWEDGGQLSGHWTGYYLSALAQCYADQGEQVYQDKIDWMVNELAAVQAAITAKFENPPNPSRFRSAGSRGNSAMRYSSTGRAAPSTSPCRRRSSRSSPTSRSRRGCV